MTALTKITSKSSCQHCGAALWLVTSGRRKRFCSVRCRKALKREGISGQKSAVEGVSGRVVAKTKKWPKMASQPIEAKELFFRLGYRRRRRAHRRGDVVVPRAVARSRQCGS